jgi:1,4-dihydroxy-2-naphthoate octaprenyltransferase
VNSRVAAFARLARPTFLAGSFVSVGLGTAIAAFAFHGVVDWQMWLAAQLTVTSGQLMTHFANEYFDRHADRYTTPTAFSGGSGVLAGGFLGPRVALRTALVWAMLTLVGIAWLDVSGQQTAAWLAVAIAILAWTYSAPPVRLLARGFGEIETALIVAVLAPLCAASAQGLHLNDALAIATLPGAAAMFAMMLAVEVPDREADALGGKRNLVVRLGRRGAALLASLAIAAAYTAVGFTVAGGAPRSVAILACITVPSALGLLAAFWRASSNSSEGPGVAARGVAFFFLVVFMELLGFIVPLPWRFS